MATDDVKEHGEDLNRVGSIEAADSLSDPKNGTFYSPLGAASREPANLKRGLNGRHTALIAIASGIGTGLFLSSGSALASAGPLGILIGYVIMGIVVAAIAFVSAETAGYLPVSGGFIRHVPLFTDRALGITVGYTFWYLLSITSAAEIVAASSLIAYWRADLNIAIFISVFLVVLFVLNMLPVRVYGEMEFSFGIIKSLLIIGLIIAGLLVDWGVSPSGEYIGGKNWSSKPIKEYLVTGSTGRFLAVWNVLINAAFAMGNIQIATSAAGEVMNPRVNVPKAMRRVFWRIFIFYIVSLFVVGLILNSDDERISTLSGTAGSPFVIAFSSAGIKVLPSIINAVVITSAFSSANGVLFLASRTLVGLAADGAAPQIFLKTNKFGSPYLAVVVSFLFSLLAYLNCGSSAPATVFGWFINLISTAGLIIWCVICFAYVRFFFGLKARGISRDELPYKSWGQPYSAIAAGIMCFLVVFFSGFAVFFPGNFTASAFLSNYIACFVCPALYIVLKFTIKSPWQSYETMDFSEMDAIREERVYNEAHPKQRRSFVRRAVEKFTDE
ncbi:amino acid permease/ SLC12A domain-containing protein [Calycina marina]|uniref:Amino acid permease/ SLC12A domain-containing protein n=1 Tax=Calycina marina TaxID=1763456 RepID=A0A9P7Z378_9HELO|nr:amino acid permease/ SLC12A domain-containing protein [Calycina marina]